MAYYNTNNEKGDIRDKSWRNTYNQEKMIMFIFFSHCFPLLVVYVFTIMVIVLEVNIYCVQNGSIY